MKCVFLIFLLAVVAFGQNDKCDHASIAKERFDAIRILPPVKILSFDGLTIEYSHEDRTGLHLGSLKISTETKLPSDFGKAYKREAWWLLYCDKDKFLYSAHPLGPEQRKTLK